MQAAPQSVTVKATLAVPLSADEMKRYADSAAKLMADLDQAEEEYKGEQREWRNRLKALRLEMRKFLTAYANKSEEREVECEQFFCLDTKEKWFVYNGEEYQRQAMDEYEVARVKQGNLFGDGANLPAEARVEHSDSDDNQQDGDWDSADDVSSPPELESVL